MKKIVIAIDGRSSTGKSTLAKALGRALGYTYISSGDMYRAVTLYFLENNTDIHDEQAVRTALQNIHLEFRLQPEGNCIYLNGRNVHEDIRTMPVNELVSPVATISQVRREMVRQQQAMGQQGGIVMDGRDIGTVVFPEAELKIFVTAEQEERAKRRYLELVNKGLDVNYEEVKKNLLERDHIDSNREDSPLRRADDAIILDNTHLNHEQQLAQVLEWVESGVGSS